MSSIEYTTVIRPHQAFDSRTPAQAAGIDLKLGRNRWMEVIQKSVEHLKDDKSQ